jgi:ubiquinone/menaquinone biosynthesis C-methylase UbiE
VNLHSVGFEKLHRWGKSVSSEYLTDEEYQTYWFRLEGLRTQISKSLRLQRGMKILDVGTGYALFAIEVAKKLERGEIVGVDIVSDGVIKARNLVKKTGVANVVSIAKVDAVKLSFPNDSFDLVTSFLGMRDIYMTRNREGVKKAVEEIIRVVKPDGHIVLCITSPEDMKAQDQKIAVELEGEIFGAKSLPKKFYFDIFKKSNVEVTETKAYFTHKKMTTNQTKTEFRDGIRIARKIYGKRVPTFKKVWNEYCEKIEDYGYGMYSKIVVLKARKLN